MCDWSANPVITAMFENASLVQRICSMAIRVRLSNTNWWGLLPNVHARKCVSLISADAVKGQGKGRMGGARKRSHEELRQQAVATRVYFCMKIASSRQNPMAG
jgi:hypothetical protein